MRSITKFLFVIAMVGGVSSAFAKYSSVAEYESRSTQDRHITGFSGVNVAGSFDVVITQGSSESVKVEAPEEVIDRVITEVNNGVLSIYNKRDNFSWGDWFSGHSKKIVVYVTAKNLNSVGLSGSGDVSFREGINTPSMKLRISGSGDISGKLNTQTLELSISGSGDVKLEGRADNANIRVSGSGDYSGRNLATVNTTIHVSGSGDATINASSRIEASVSGSGDIGYTGGATQVSTSKSGSGSIHHI